MAVAGSVGFGLSVLGRALFGVASVGPGTRIPWRHMTPGSVRRGGVSRLVGVTKTVPPLGMAVLASGFCELGPLPLRHTV